jgi:PAS domain S-box-containing protein
MDLSRPAREESLEAAAFAVFAALLFGATAWGGLELTRGFGRVATIWPCNGLVVSLLLLRPRRQWPLVLALCFLANLLVNHFAGDTVTTSIGLSLANTLEIVIAAFALRDLPTEMSELINTRSLLRLLAYAALIAPAVSGGLVSLGLSLANDAPLGDTFRNWWTADALGMAVMIPLVLAVRPQELLESIRGQTAGRVLFPFALFILTTCAVFAQSKYPLLFLIVPTVLLIAFRLGLAASAIAIFLLAAISLAFTLAGHGPLMLVNAPGITSRIVSIQLFIAALIVTTYPVCAVVANQRRLLRKVEASEERFRIIAVNSTDLITLADDQGNWNYLSPSVTTIFGWSAQELVGRNGLDYVHPEDAKMFAAGVGQLREGRDVLAGSFRMRRRDGRYVWVETISGVLREAQTGAVVGWVSNVRDISARKRVEEIKNEFISTVSHELRTPLTALLGSIGLAASGKFGTPNDSLKRLLEMAKTNGERLGQLVNDILDFEKASFGRMRFNLEPCPVDTLIDQALIATRPYAERLNITLVARHRMPGTAIRVDPDRFQQIMANLLSNAAKFSTSGGRVEIDAGVLEGRCRISVIDHGCGIPKDFRESLFERFSQADNSDGRTRGGTGLGMAIAKHLTEQMSGRISFESEENVGTTFHLDFGVADSRVDVARVVG